MVSYLKKFFLIAKRKRMSEQLQLRFLKRLYRLLTNGYPLIEALKVIMWDQQMKRPAKHIKTLLKNGYALDEALANVYFHQNITSYLYFVRTHGQLQHSLKKCIIMLENRLTSIHKFKQTIRYPIILFVIFFLLLFVLRQFVLPSFIKLYETNPEASSTIIISVKIINIFITSFFILFLLIFFLILIWRVKKHALPVHKRIKIYQSIPIYRTFMTLQTSYQLAVHFSALLKTGMPIKNILQTIAKQQKLPIIAYYASLMTMQLTKGYHLSHTIKQLPLIEPQLTYILQQHTQMSALEKDLTTYTELLTEDIKFQMQKMITMIQPIIFAIIASFIIFIYITLMWPMFQLIQTI